MEKIEAIYTASATATGGRDGHVISSNGALNVDVRVPNELGGPSGNYINPEILFAAGYASCFDSALALVIRTEKVQAGITTVTADVSLGKTETGEYGLAVKVQIEIPGVERQQAEDLVNKAHHICPYSSATRGNIEVQLIVR